jgi:hypothetical protein
MKEVGIPYRSSLEKIDIFSNYDIFVSVSWGPSTLSEQR